MYVKKGTLNGPFTIHPSCGSIHGGTICNIINESNNFPIINSTSNPNDCTKVKLQNTINKNEIIMDDSSINSKSKLQMKTISMEKGIYDVLFAIDGCNFQSTHSFFISYGTVCFYLHGNISFFISLFVVCFSFFFLYVVKQTLLVLK